MRKRRLVRLSCSGSSEQPSVPASKVQERPQRRAVSPSLAPASLLSRLPVPALPSRFSSSQFLLSVPPFFPFSPGQGRAFQSLPSPSSLKPDRVFRSSLSLRWPPCPLSRQVCPPSPVPTSRFRFLPPTWMPAHRSPVF